MVRTVGNLPERWREGLVQVGTAPINTVLRQRSWEDLVWRKPMRLELESGIPRDRMLPGPVGHYVWEEDGERGTCHGMDGPCLWPKLKENAAGVEPVYVFDRKRPPGHLRQLTSEEIWKLQGRSVVGLNKGALMEQMWCVKDAERQVLRRRQVRLLCAGDVMEMIMEEHQGRNVCRG